MEQALSVFEKIGIRTVFKKGDSVFSQGDVSDRLYYIEKGRVEIFSVQEKGEKILAVLRSGELLGEMSLFDSADRSASARAAEEIVLLELRREDFNRFMYQNPGAAFEFTKHVVNTLSHRLRISNNYLISIYLFSLGILHVKEEDVLTGLLFDKISSSLSGVSRSFLYLWNRFNEEFELKKASGDRIPDAGITFGSFDPEIIREKLDAAGGLLSSVGEEKILGFVYIEKKEEFKEEEKILVETFLHLAAPVFHNLRWQEEENNLKRLKTYRQ